MTLLDCRDKVTDNLNANFTEFTAQAKLVSVSTFEDVIEMQVFVIPIRTIVTKQTRGKSQKIYTIQIGIIQKVTSNDVDPEDVLPIVQSIEDNFNDKNLPEGQVPADYRSKGVRTMPFYDYSQLDTKKIIQSVVEVDYEVLE